MLFSVALGTLFAIFTGYISITAPPGDIGVTFHLIPRAKALMISKQATRIQELEHLVQALKASQTMTEDKLEQCERNQSTAWQQLLDNPIALMLFCVSVCVVGYVLEATKK